MSCPGLLAAPRAARQRFEWRRANQTTNPRPTFHACFPGCDALLAAARRANQTGAPPRQLPRSTVSFDLFFVFEWRGVPGSPRRARPFRNKNPAPLPPSAYLVSFEWRGTSTRGATRIKKTIPPATPSSLRSLLIARSRRTNKRENLVLFGWRRL